MITLSITSSGDHLARSYHTSIVCNNDAAKSVVEIYQNGGKLKSRLLCHDHILFTYFASLKIDKTDEGKTFLLLGTSRRKAHAEGDLCYTIFALELSNISSMMKCDVAGSDATVEEKFISSVGQVVFQTVDTLVASSSPPRLHLIPSNHDNQLILIGQQSAFWLNVEHEDGNPSMQFTEDRRLPLSSAAPGFEKLTLLGAVFPAPSETILESLVEERRPALIRSPRFALHLSPSQLPLSSSSATTPVSFFASKELYSLLLGENESLVCNEGALLYASIHSAALRAVSLQSPSIVNKLTLDRDSSDGIVSLAPWRTSPVDPSHTTLTYASQLLLFSLQGDAILLTPPSTSFALAGTNRLNRISLTKVSSSGVSPLTTFSPIFSIHVMEESESISVLACRADGVCFVSSVSSGPGDSLRSSPAQIVPIPCIEVAIQCQRVLQDESSVSRKVDLCCCSHDPHLPPFVVPRAFDISLAPPIGFSLNVAKQSSASQSPESLLSELRQASSRLSAAQEREKRATSLLNECARLQKISSFSSPSPSSSSSSSSSSFSFPLAVDLVTDRQIFSLSQNAILLNFSLQLISNGAVAHGEKSQFSKDPRDFEAFVNLIPRNSSLLIEVRQSQAASPPNRNQRSLIFLEPIDRHRIALRETGSFQRMIPVCRENFFTQLTLNIWLVWTPSLSSSFSSSSSSSSADMNPLVPGGLAIPVIRGKQLSWIDFLSFHSTDKREVGRRADDATAALAQLSSSAFFSRPLFSLNGQSNEPSAATANENTYTSSIQILSVCPNSLALLQLLLGTDSVSQSSVVAQITGHLSLKLVVQELRQVSEAEDHADDSGRHGGTGKKRKRRTKQRRLFEIHIESELWRVCQETRDLLFTRCLCIADAHEDLCSIQSTDAMLNLALKSAEQREKLSKWRQCVKKKNDETYDSFVQLSEESTALAHQLHNQVESAQRELVKKFIL